MGERRNHRRDLTYLGARVAFNGRGSTMDCLVRNLSTDGAKLSFSSTLGLPVECEISIRAGEPRPARVVWREERTAGVEFMRPQKR